MKTVDDHEKFISRMKLINSSKKHIKKAPGIDQMKNKLIKCIKSGLFKLLHFFFNLRINFDIHPLDFKIA